MRRTALDAKHHRSVAHTCHPDDLCRQQRLRELREASTRPVTATLELIRSSEFKEKVTNASQKCWVVVLLFKPEYAPDLFNCCCG